MPDGPALASAQTGSRGRKTPDGFTTDRALYAVLKLHVYANVHDGVLRALLAGRALPLDHAVHLEVGRFTSRKASHLLVSETGARGHASAEFHGFTSHKVREKLERFRDLGVVELIGKGLRDAATYRWNEPLKLSEVCSFMRLRARTAEDLTLNLELHRLRGERGFAPFTAKDFVDLYARVHGAEYGGTRWGKRKWERVAGSFEYAEGLRARLDRLLMAGLVLQEGETFRLDPTLDDALRHFALFLDGEPFAPPPAMCAACPLDPHCRAGSTQRALAALAQP